MGNKLVRQPYLWTDNLFTEQNIEMSYFMPQKQKINNQRYWLLELHFH